MAAILITGANRGLGFEFASQYLADGWRVFAACRNPDAASKLRCLAQDTGGMLNVIAMDVTDAQSVRNAATQLKDVAIDVLINSAGIAGASGQKTGNVDYQSWAHVLDVNTMGPLRVLESFSDHIARSERKLVITRRGPWAPEPGNGTNRFRGCSLGPSRAVGDRPEFAARPA